jgi:hypothetical protein
MSDVEAPATAPSFFDLYVNGAAAPGDIHEYVGRWHDSYQAQSEYPPLHEYLGLTRDEYEILLYDPFALPFIRQSRQPGQDLVAIMAERYEQLRAAHRREDDTIIFLLGNWLKARSGH